MRWPLLLRMIFLVWACCLIQETRAQAPSDVPQQYQRLFYHYSDHRKLYEKALNTIGLSSLPVGRSFALIAGVTQYPNFPPLERELKPAQVDIEKLKSYLKDQEYFDEIVVLKDGDMNLDTLNYFLDDYFPEQLKKFPHSRFLFAYSGHGYAESTDEAARGFVLTSPAVSKTDPVNRINLSTLRSLLNSDIDAAEKVLVLINACQSGAFLGRQSFGVNPLGPGDRGAYAILASRKTQQSWSLSSVGPGSVFYEKLFAGLNGAADNSPRDGVVTYHELDTYLRSEIPYATSGNQIPMEGDISRDGSQGEFFFLNRARQVQLGNAKVWNPGSLTSFGEQKADLMELGMAADKEARYQDAAQAFGQAADSGNTAAMSNLGVLYEKGQGVTQSYQLARQWDEKAANGGNADGMNNLGYLYEHGQGVPQDYAQARQWYEKAANAGNSDGMYNLGVIYQNGEGVPQDYAQARQWYEKAFNGGNSDGMVGLGYIYENGRGAPQDYGQARQWYEKAANSGNSYGMVGLGGIYSDGLGVPQDYAQARQWYEKAANGGNELGMYNLGVIYQNGEGVPKDFQQARIWYEKAAAAGDPDAPQRLQELPK